MPMKDGTINHEIFFLQVKKKPEVSRERESE